MLEDESEERGTVGCYVGHIERKKSLENVSKTFLIKSSLAHVPVCAFAYSSI